MLLGIYKAMMRASTPLLEVYLQKRQRRGKEDPARAAERRGAGDRPRGTRPLAWFHAASVGESLSMLAVVTRVLQDAPDIDVMVTTGTVTSAKLMAERLPQGAFHQYIPVDHPSWVATFLDHWQPGLVVWAESEFWPNMLLAVKARGIPAVLLNARMSEGSFKRWKWAKGSISSMLSAFSLCLAQNAAEAARLTALGARDVRVSANLKYAAAPLPADVKDLKGLTDIYAERPVILWASTHPGEEELALDTHKALQGAFPQLSTIIVPRHPSRGAEVLSLAQKAGYTGALRSRADKPQDIYIADTLGELGLFFRLCPIVVMGGSFADIGGHNPIEPGQLGCTVYYGPQMYNFLTISDDFLTHRAAVQVSGQPELVEKLRAALTDPPSVAPIGAAAKELTQQKSHIVDDLSATLAPYLVALRHGRKAVP